MSINIIKQIIDYTGDFELPGHQDQAARNIAKKKYGVSDDELGVTMLKAEKVVYKILFLFFDKPVGSFSIIEKENQKSVQLKVAKEISENGVQTFEAWLDGDIFTDILGRISLEAIKKTSSGRLWSPKAKKEIPENHAYERYTKEAPGMVYIIDLQSFKKAEYLGTGTGLMQVAAEVSLISGFGLKLMLEASGNSPGFYRKLKLTTHFEMFDQAIDEILKKWKKGEEPKTDGYGGYMYLEKEGQAKFTDMISKNPILDSHKS